MLAEISIEEYFSRDQDQVMILDVRAADAYVCGSLPGACSLPLKELESFYDETESGKDETASSRLTKRWPFLADPRPKYVLCYTGENAPRAVRYLQTYGIEAGIVAGGYRAFLRRELEHLAAKDDLVVQKTREIERSLIKKFRKQLWCNFTRAIREYDLISDGDRIAVCISGGKDSMLLAKLMQELYRHGKQNFELVFLVMNPGYNTDNWRIIENNARLLGIPLMVFESQIFDTVANTDRNPCYLCARMRRGYLYAHAKKLGCNKIALGHHFDDVIETVLMGMLYAGKFETMMPKLPSIHFEGMELIRPLYQIKEADIKAWRDYNGLHFIQCACRFTENCATCGGGRGSRRDDMKELIARFRAESPLIEQNIFNSTHNVNLRTILGYKKDGQLFSFLDDYEERVTESLSPALDRKEVQL